MGNLTWLRIIRRKAWRAHRDSFYGRLCIFTEERAGVKSRFKMDSGGGRYSAIWAKKAIWVYFRGNSAEGELNDLLSANHISNVPSCGGYSHLHLA